MGGTSIPIEKSFITNGYGYVTIPTDMVREDYLRDFYRTGQCIMLTTYNEVKKRVSVPKHLINEITFPNLPGDKGSFIHWQRVPGIGRFVVTGIHLLTTEFTSSSEKERISTKSTQENSISVVENIEVGSYSISVVGTESKPGEINLLVKDGQGRTSKVILNGGGAITVESTEFEAKSSTISFTVDKDKKVTFDEDECTIEFGTQKITIDKDMIVIDSKNLVSISSGNSSVDVTQNGVVIETDKGVFVNGSKPVLYAKLETAVEILDVSEIGISKSVKVGE